MTYVYTLIAKAHGAPAQAWKRILRLYSKLSASCTCRVTYSYLACVASVPSEPCTKREPGFARLCRFAKQRCLTHYCVASCTLLRSSTMYSFLTQGKIVCNIDESSKKREETCKWKILWTERGDIGIGEKAQEISLMVYRYVWHFVLEPLLHTSWTADVSWNAEIYTHPR